MTDDDFLQQPMFTIEPNRTENRLWTLQATEAVPERVQVVELVKRGDGYFSTFTAKKPPLTVRFRPQGDDWLYHFYMAHHPDTRQHFPRRTLIHMAVLGTLGVPTETTAVVLS